MLEDYFTHLHHTTSTVKGKLSNVGFIYSEKKFIERCKLIFSEYSGEIADIDSNFMHLHNAEHPPQPVKKPVKKKATVNKRKRRMKGDGKCFESCISVRVKGSYKDFDGNIIDNYYKIKVFQNGNVSIPGAREAGFADIKTPLSVIRDFMALIFDKPVEIVSLSSSMLNYKYFLKSEGNRVRQIDIPTACQVFNNIKSNCPLTNMNIVMDYLLNQEYSKEGLRYHIASADECVKNLRVGIDELDELIRIKEIPEKKETLKVLAEVMSQNMIINPKIYKEIFERYLLNFVIVAEEMLKNSVHNLLRQVTYNSDDNSSVMVEFRSPIVKKSGKGVKFKIFDSGKINIAGAVTEESTIFMTNYLNKILADEKNNIIYHDDEESCTSEDTSTDDIDT